MLQHFSFENNNYLHEFFQMAKKLFTGEEDSLSLAASNRKLKVNRNMIIYVAHCYGFTSLVIRASCVGWLVRMQGGSYIPSAHAMSPSFTFHGDSRKK